MPRGVYDRSRKTPETEETTVAKPAVEESVPVVEPGAEVSDAGNSVDSTVEQPCAAHFPDGWPEGVTSAGCVDGMWQRELSESD